jgi:uncharacterized membrane protein YedE/YeeE
MAGAEITGAGGVGAMLTALLFALIAGIVRLVVVSVLPQIGVAVMGEVDS